jgi:hypothetical protein
LELRPEVIAKQKARSCERALKSQSVIRISFLPAQSPQQ